MSALTNSAVDMISGNVHERREKGKAFLTPSEKELLDRLCNESDGDVITLSLGLQGVGDLMAASEQDLIPDEVQKVGMLITETTKAIVYSVNARESAELLQGSPVLEKAPWEEAKDAWLAAMNKHLSDKKREQALSELSEEQTKSFILWQLSKRSVEEQKAIIEEVKSSTKEKDKAEA